MNGEMIVADLRDGWNIPGIWKYPLERDVSAASSSGRSVDSGEIKLVNRSKGLVKRAVPYLLRVVKMGAMP